MQLSVVIVNYNVKYFLEQCLAALRMAVQGIECETWVVDNHSTDGSVAYLAPLFPEVHFLPLEANLGFARANNAALSKCKGEYILFLNPDTMVTRPSIEEPLAYLQKHAEAGALGIAMHDGSGRYLPESKRGFPSPATALFKQAGLHRWFPQSPKFARYYMGHLPINKTAEVEVLAGAFMLIRKTVLEKVGSFDPQFFMYGEDIDLSFRILQAGYRNVYFGNSSIIHFKGESTAKSSIRYVKMFYEAMQRFVKKHYSGNGAWAYRLLLYAGIGIRAMAGAVRRLFSRPSAHVAWPPSLSFFAIGWPEEQAKPNAMQLPDGQVIQLEWKENAGEDKEQVLLVIGEKLSLQQAIEYMQQNGRRHNCWMHVALTQSVVMSNDKNKAGVAALLLP